MSYHHIPVTDTKRQSVREREVEEHVHFYVQNFIEDCQFNRFHNFLKVWHGVATIYV